MGDLLNMNERRAWDMLSEYIDNNDTSELCLCGICLTDMVAITLNNIPAHYQVERHDLIAAKNKVPDTEIYRQLKKAIVTVKERPHH
jgi:competence protein ComFB